MDTVGTVSYVRDNRDAAAGRKGGKEAGRKGERERGRELTFKEKGEGLNLGREYNSVSHVR